MSETRHRLYTATQVRLLDAAALQALGITDYELMCRAGTAAFEAIRAEYPAAKRWLLACGSGNNGGDGYVVARLAKAAGLEVTVAALAPVAGLSGAAERAARDWLDSGGEIITWVKASRVETDLAVDALFGTGLNRAPEGAYAEAIDALNRRPGPRIALDIPSGLSADTGVALGPAVRADLTVSFVGRKRGLYTGDGPDHAGRLVFDDLGLPEAAARSVDCAGHLLNLPKELASLPVRRRNGHKGDHGHVLVIGGAAGMGGAVRLAGEAALRAGAGLVTIATHPVHAHWLNLNRPELMTRAVAAAPDLEPAMSRATVLAIGPGLGRDAWALGLLDAVFTDDRPLVVDADALNLLGDKHSRQSPWVITPHPGEAARLLGCSTGEVQADRFRAALELARRNRAVAVLKGCGTLVAEPGGAWALCPLGNPGMATGGSGDVLTGVIAALLAQGLDAWHAACLGVTVHAAAGDRAAAQGQRGLLAGDIIAALGPVLNG